MYEKTSRRSFPLGKRKLWNVSALLQPGDVPPYPGCDSSIPRGICCFLLPVNAMEQAYVRQIFLWSLGAIYLFAFLSLYVQIPGKSASHSKSKPEAKPGSRFSTNQIVLTGLYGTDGLLPVFRLMPFGKKNDLRANALVESNKVHIPSPSPP